MELVELAIDQLTLAYDSSLIVHEDASVRATCTDPNAFTFIDFVYPFCNEISDVLEIIQDDQDDIK